MKKKSMDLSSLKTSVVRNKKRLREQTIKSFYTSQYQNLNLVKNSYKHKEIFPNIRTLPASQMTHDYAPSNPVSNLVSLKASQVQRHNTTQPGKSHFRSKSIRFVQSSYGPRTHKKKPKTAATRADSKEQNSQFNNRNRNHIFSGRTGLASRFSTSKVVNINQVVKQQKRAQSAMHRIKPRVHFKENKPATAKPNVSTGQPLVVNNLLGLFARRSAKPVQGTFKATREVCTVVKEIDNDEVVNLNQWKFQPSKNFVKSNKNAVKSKTLNLSESSKLRNSSKDFQIAVHVNKSSTLIQSEDPNEMLMTSAIKKSEIFFDFPSGCKMPSKIDVVNFPSGFSINEFEAQNTTSILPDLGKQHLKMKKSKFVRQECNKLSNFND